MNSHLLRRNGTVCGETIASAGAGGQLFQSSSRIESARSWGPCILGIEEAERGLSPSTSQGPTVFCGVIVPCTHEAALQAQGFSCCTAAMLSGGDQERLARVVEADPYMAWLVRAVPPEAAAAPRCSLGVVAHTAAAAIIKEALAAGVHVRSVRVSSSCDAARYRQFLFEAFPSVCDITVCAPRLSNGNNGNSMNNSNGVIQGTGISPVVCAAGVLALAARNGLSRQMLYRQRAALSQPARSPLSRAMEELRRRQHGAGARRGAGLSVCASPVRRLSVDAPESAPGSSSLGVVRCAAFAGSEGDVVSPRSCGIPIASSAGVQNGVDPDDFDASLSSLMSPKRIRVIPCSPPLSSVVVHDESSSGTSGTPAFAIGSPVSCATDTSCGFSHALWHNNGVSTLPGTPPQPFTPMYSMASPLQSFE